MRLLAAWGMIDVRNTPFAERGFARNEPSRSAFATALGSRSWAAGGVRAAGSGADRGPGDRGGEWRYGHEPFARGSTFGSGVSGGQARGAAEERRDAAVGQPGRSDQPGRASAEPD